MAKRNAPKVEPPLDPESEAWNTLAWRKLEQHCLRIQKRIFRASQRGNTRAVHTLQKLLTRIPISQAPGSSTGHSGQPGQENCGH
jgi:RNA-directed DNA polymerase